MISPKVAVIGCGPGGMFFAHAVEACRRQLGEQTGEASLANLPEVTCFERASGPGGVWRSKRRFDNDDIGKSAEFSEEKKGSDDVVQLVRTEETTNMYEALWTNGPKEAIEFADYTFDDHFGGPLPVYMPRQALLEYMICRVTKDCPTFFEDYVKFNTSVMSVKYMEQKKKFEVITHNALTNEIVTGEYDKCIWAAGENGKPKIPAPMVAMFREGGFQGRMIHSSDTSNFEKDVKGKKVLFIGGSYSAEDLALMAIKVGAAKVFISTRTDDNVVTYTKSWPQGKVDILVEMTPVGVTESGRCIQFSKTECIFPTGHTIDSAISMEIRDIETIVFCTGYSPNVDMLADELRTPFGNPIERQLKVPVDWKMSMNAMTEALGDVIPGDVRWYLSLCRYPDTYRGVLISNPSMMYIENEIFENPIFGTDVHAKLLLGFIMGTTKLPSKDDMRRLNLEDALQQMDNVSLRVSMDSNYRAKLLDSIEEMDEMEADRLYDEWDNELMRVQFQRLAQMMEEANYQVSYGSFGKLNAIAEKLLKYSEWSGDHRTCLDPTNEDESDWRTFRDIEDAERFSSVFTGTKAVPLKTKWLETDV